jgi:hypothetical protein
MLMLIFFRIENYWYAQKIGKLHFLWDRYSVRIKEGFRNVDMFEVSFEVFVNHLSMSDIKIKKCFQENLGQSPAQYKNST